MKRKMNIATFLAVPLCLGIIACHGLECPTAGWSQAENICYRFVHFPESYWSAYRHCQAVGGTLLQLKNVKKVMASIGQTMEGNADDFRIDGHAKGKWYKRVNESLQHEEYEFLNSLSGKTLTLNVQDGRVSGNTDLEKRLGFICEGDEDLSKLCNKEMKSPSDATGNSPPIATSSEFTTEDATETTTTSSNTEPASTTTTTLSTTTTSKSTTTTTMSTTTTTTQNPLNKNLETAINNDDYATFKSIIDGGYNVDTNLPVKRLDGNEEKEVKEPLVCLVIVSRKPTTSAMMNLLLEKEVDVNVRCTEENRTPLLVLAEQGEFGDKTALMEALLDHGANATWTDSTREAVTALHYVATNAVDGKQVDLLIKKGQADTEARDKYGLTPLHYAIVSTKSDEVALTLLRNKANINAQSIFGNTPAHHVLQKLGFNGFDRAKLLVTKGADYLKVKNNDGHTLKGYVEYMKHRNRRYAPNAKKYDELLQWLNKQ